MVIATDGSETYVLFLYRDVQWGESDTSIGFNAGDGVRGFNLPRPSGSSTFLGIESSSNANIPGSYYFRVDDNIREPDGITLLYTNFLCKINFTGIMNTTASVLYNFVIQDQQRFLQ